LWHFSAFLLSGTPQSAWSFTSFCWFDCRPRDRDAIVQRIAQQRPASRIIYFQLINPVWPDAQPYDALVF
jgi:hypothetical protein